MANLVDSSLTVFVLLTIVFGGAEDTAASTTTTTSPTTQIMILNETATSTARTTTTIATKTETARAAAITTTTIKTPEARNPDPRSKVPVIIQEAGKWIPELGKILDASSSPNATQLEDIYQFILNFIQLKKAPQSILKFMEELKESDLFDVLRTTPTYNTTQIPTTPSPLSPSWGKCQEDLFTLLDALSSRELWAWKMLDASGKPGHSMFKGNGQFWGNHKECHEAQSPHGNHSQVEGNICRLSFNVPLALTENGEPKTLADLNIAWDLCVPKTCIDSDLKFVSNQILFGLSQISKVNVTCTADLHFSDDAGAVIAIVILVLLGLLILVGTLTEAILTFLREDEEDTVINGYEANTTARAFINKGLNIHETSFDAETHEGGHRPLSRISQTEEASDTSNGRGPPFSKDILRPVLPVLGFRDLARGGSKNHSTYMPGENFGDPSDKGSVDEFTPGGKEEDEEDCGKDETASLPCWQRFLLAFSILGNIEKILAVRSPRDTVRCLHGVKVLSLVWIILAHTYVTPLGSPRNHSLKVLSTWRGQIIYNGTLAIDTFILLSGLLTAYACLQKCGKRRKIPVKTGFRYFVHRLWRFTSPYMLWVMVVATLLQYIGEGRPAWKDYVGAQQCRDNWWTNLLYINNLYRNDRQCLPVSWYIASGMQFHIVAPLVIVPWIYGGKIAGFLVAGLMITLHLASSIWLQISIDSGDIIRNSSKYFTDIHVQPYTRVAPYAIGLMVGWGLWKSKCKLYINKYAGLVGWFLCFFLIITLTLVTYDENKHLGSDSWTIGARTAFETLSRPLWGLAVGWIALACATGNGGFINSFLSWNGWLPLSRLTFCVYLVHGTIITFEESFAGSAMFLSETIMIYRFMGYLFMSYLVGLLLSLVAESPLVALEKIIFPWK